MNSKAAPSPGPTRIVHFTWKDGRPPDDIFPRWWRETWHQAGWKIRIWTDADIATFVGNLPKSLQRLFSSYSRNVMRADAFRYLLLKQMGGLYVDLDFVNFGSLEWLEDFPGFACAAQGDQCLCNAFLWSPKPDDPFWDGIEDTLLAYSTEENPVSATGPRFLTAHARNRPARRIPTTWVYPIAWDDFPAIAAARHSDLAGLRRTYPEARAIHIWTGSWFEECGVPRPSLPSETQPPVPPPPRASEAVQAFAK